MTLDEATAEAEKVLKEAGQKAIVDVEVPEEPKAKAEPEVKKTSTGKKKTK